MASNATNLAACHRFRDELALSVCDHESGAMVYLSLAQARELRAALGRIIRSIERHGFTESPSGLSYATATRDRRYSHGARIERKNKESV